MRNMIVDNGRDVKVHFLPVEKIRPNPYQPRKDFDKFALGELATSIKEYGVMQPINVRHISGTNYELVSGERRLRASKLAGMETIPAIIIHISDNESAIIALIENLQRQNLNYLEEAEGYQNLMSDYGITQEELARKMGKSQSAIANKLRILKLSETVKNMLLENDLTERHARALLRLPEEEFQIDILYSVIEQALNVKKTEDLVEETLMQIRNDALKKGKQQKVQIYIKDMRLITNTIRQAIDVMSKSGFNVVYDIDEKDNLYEVNIKIPF